MSTAWQAMQFLLLARASSAMAGAEMAAMAAIIRRARFMELSSWVKNENVTDPILPIRIFVKRRLTVSCRALSALYRRV
ncbi:hypothetical protein D9M69_714800 [compost metagenome]